MLIYRALGHFGALGNQLWEIASTIGLARKLECDFLFPSWDYQPYFSLSGDIFVAPSYLEAKEIDLSGNYLQDIRHWYHIEDEIRELFAPSEFSKFQMSQIPEYEGISNYAAIHVRRANNLTLPNHHPVPPTEFFQQAMEQVSGPYIVFSDDMDWCRQNPIFNGCRFAPGNDPLIDVYQLTGANPLTLESAALDLLAMAQCRRHIISNSTFSWWAAFLGSSEQVIYPLNWYGPMVKADYTLMMKGLQQWWNGI